MKPDSLAEIRQSQQQMLAKIDEIEQAYRARPDGVEADPELEQWLADSRQSVADQQAWLSGLQADQIERQRAQRQQLVGIAVLLLVLIGIFVFS
ncbi:hypothetical protein HPT27_03350 [Permianibacter sp. IMCC34836]|uniref:hypothetical protein n=1 Tax=Permianibacter fluminis TaxID=2738515 RepID=UPI001557DFAD|nr:hypothetical protein [Permianibacter fluminis]NQD36045.1 hypothetical protein [Permianibacter fluminis]